jgi:hypothetical protein
MLFKNSVHTSMRTPYFTIKEIDFVTILKEIILFTLRIILKTQIKNTELLTVKAARKYSYQLALKG